VPVTYRASSEASHSNGIADVLGLDVGNLHRLLHREHEFRVLSYLMHHSDRVVSQGELTEHIYAQDSDRDSNTVEVFIARLRRKLGASLIETVRGLGYRIGA